MKSIESALEEVVKIATEAVSFEDVFVLEHDGEKAILNEAACKLMCKVFLSQKNKATELANVLRETIHEGRPVQIDLKGLVHNTRLLHALCEYQEILNAELTAELNGEKLFVFKANGRTAVMNMAVMENFAETGCPTGLPDEDDFQKAMDGAMTTTVNISDLIIGGGSCMN